MPSKTKPAEASAPGLSEEVREWIKTALSYLGMTVYPLSLEATGEDLLTRASAATVGEAKMPDTSDDPVNLLHRVLTIAGFSSEDAEYQKLTDALAGAAQQQAEPKCGACDGTGLMQHASGDPQDAVNCPACAEQQAEPGADERGDGYAGARLLAICQKFGVTVPDGWSWETIDAARFALLGQIRSAIESNKPAGYFFKASSLHPWVQIEKDNPNAVPLYSAAQSGQRAGVAEALDLIDRKALAGLCQMTHEGARAFLNEIREIAKGAAPTQQQEGG